MKYHKQNVFHDPSKNVRGNCFQTCIACLLDMEIDDVLPCQYLFHTDRWVYYFMIWLNGMGYEIEAVNEHPMDNSFYLVAGESPRFKDTLHQCIYQNGKLAHDPHPDNTGILDERIIEVLKIAKD